MVAKLLGQPLTFGDEEQIKFIQKEEEIEKIYKVLKDRGIFISKYERYERF